MAALTQTNPIIGLGLQQPPASTRSSRRKAAAAIPAPCLRSFNISASSSFARFSYDINLLPRKPFQSTFASNPDPLPGKKSIRRKATDSSSSNETETTPQGPPFLTIVAGAMVFFLVCWVVGSLVICVVSPIVNLFFSK